MPDYPNNYKGAGGDPDPKDFSPKWVDYGDWNKGANKLYMRYLKDQVQRHGLGVQPRVVQERERTGLYQTVGNQQMSANRMANQSLARSFGGNNPTGLSASLQAQNALSAPYSTAAIQAQNQGIAASEIKRRAALQAGSASVGATQAQANWYATMLAPIFQQRSLDLQQESINNAAALGLAANAGGGSSYGPAIGAGLGSFFGSQFAGGQGNQASMFGSGGIGGGGGGGFF